MCFSFQFQVAVGIALDVIGYQLCHSMVHEEIRRCWHDKTPALPTILLYLVQLQLLLETGT